MSSHFASPRRTSAAALLLGLWLQACSSDTPAQGEQGGTSGSAPSAGNGPAGQAGSAAQTGGSAGVTGGAAGAGAPASGASSAGNTTSAGSGGSNIAGGASCDMPGLTWKTARKTWYTSYPEPGSEECIEYSGCEYQGQFAACNDTKPETWVQAHNIVAAFPDFGTLELHDLCLKSGDKTIVVTVFDTCGDADCDGCCTENQGNADELIDLESYTNQRWGVDDGQIQWADLGPTQGDGCD